MVQPNLQAMIRREIDRALALPPVDDPFLGLHYGYQHRVLGSLVRRSGTIMQLALREILREVPHLLVLNVTEVPISEEVDRAAATYDIAGARETHLEYDPEGPRVVRPDVITLTIGDVRHDCRRTGTLDFIDIKRGGGRLASGALRALRLNLLALQMQGRSFGEHLDLRVRETNAWAVSLFGETGLSPDLTIAGEDLDAYYDYPVSTRLAEAMLFARDELSRRLPRAGDGWDEMPFGAPGDGLPPGRPDTGDAAEEQA